jgi:LemA protein
MSFGLLTLAGIYFLVLLLVVGLCFVLYAVIAYNRFVRLRTTVKTSLSDIDVILNKRYDLLSNLVETVKGYAEHENEIFTRAAELRSPAAANADIDDRIQFEGQLRGMLTGLYAVAENYPQLKADANFLRLQQTLQDLEDAIEQARKHYNAVVQEHNILLKSFPSNVIARICSFSEEDFYAGLDEQGRKVPTVNFSQ